MAKIRSLLRTEWLIESFPKAGQIEIPNQGEIEQVIFIPVTRVMGY